MLIDFLFELRRRKLPVTTHEWMALMEAMELGLHGSSLDGFYRLARAICVKDITQFDAFDDAFLAYFRGVTAESLDLTSELLSWLSDPKKLASLTEEQRQLIESLDLDRLRQLFEERLREQKERHDGGNRWIGTGGTSPFGHSGEHPTGIRVGGAGGGRSAMQIAGERRFRAYRRDRVLDVRQIDVALRGLRTLGRDGAPDELDLAESIDATSKNAGDLELVFRAPKRNRLKLILLMDVGGSMDPYADLAERLFTAASRAGRFARFRHYYFHNCVYESVYEDAAFRRPVSVGELLASSSKDERLVIVGDAFMHPAELLAAGGAIAFSHHNRKPGIEWLRHIAGAFPRRVWLNPEPERFWPGSTIEVVAEAFPMWPLTLEGLDHAVKHLARGGSR